MAAHGASSATAAMAATPSVTGRVRIAALQSSGARESSLSRVSLGLIVFSDLFHFAPSLAVQELMLVNSQPVTKYRDAKILPRSNYTTSFDTKQKKEVPSAKMLPATRPLLPATRQQVEKKEKYINIKAIGKKQGRDRSGKEAGKKWGRGEGVAKKWDTW